MQQRFAADALQCIIEKMGIDLTLQGAHLGLRFQNLSSQFQLGVVQIVLLIQQID